MLPIAAHQDNQGKKTAGVDGITPLPPKQRLTRSHTLTMGDKAAPVRRVWIPKPGADDMRPLGIPTIHDRAPYSQNIRTRFPIGGYAPYHRPHFDLSSAPPSPILSVNMD